MRCEYCGTECAGSKLVHSFDRCRDVLYAQLSEERQKARDLVTQNVAQGKDRDAIRAQLAKRDATIARLWNEADPDPGAAPYRNEMDEDERDPR